MYIYGNKHLLSWVEFELNMDIGVITFPTPTPKFCYFSQYETYHFAHYIANIWDIPAICVFCRVFGVIYDMQMLFDGNTVLHYFPMDQPLKICVKKYDKKCVGLFCSDSWKSDIAAFLELNPGISMTHRHPANWKIWFPLSPSRWDEISLWPKH